MQAASSLAFPDTSVPSRRKLCGHGCSACHAAAWEGGGGSRCSKAGDLEDGPNPCRIVIGHICWACSIWTWLRKSPKRSVAPTLWGQCRRAGRLQRPSPSRPAPFGSRGRQEKWCVGAGCACMREESAAQCASAYGSPGALALPFRSTCPRPRGPSARAARST